jgi:glycosyltransferase involved in cell wall biosynthesis
MRILFDLITPSSFVGGAGEYIRTVFFALVDAVKSNKSGHTEIVGIYDSSIGRFAYEDLSPSSLQKMNISTVDVAGKTFGQVIKENCIDKVFIGAAQYWGRERYQPWTIDVPVVCVIHDLCEEEYVSVNWNYYVMIDHPYQLFKRMLRDRIRGKKQLNEMKSIMRMMDNNRNVDIITVSNYSKSALAYHFGLKDRVHTLYSPERLFRSSDVIENPVLADLVGSGKRFYLMVSANRNMKNPNKAVNAFKRYLEVNFDKDAEKPMLVSLGYPQPKFKEHICLPYLSDSDLTNAYANCYAFLFPSYFEGFGYPPLEAMRFGKPVLASNVTSIPEISGDAAIYFSPIYETEIFHALLKLTDENYKDFSGKSLEQYLKINTRQKEDLHKVIDLILQQ